MAFTDQLVTSPQVRSSLTRAGLRDRVRGDVGLRGNNLLTDTDIDNWGGEIQDEIWQITRGWKTSCFIDAKAGQAEYDLPPRLIGLEEVHHNQLPMFKVTLSELRVGNPYWRRTADGTPLFYYVRGNSSFGLFYTPGVDIAQGIFLTYSALPPRPANDTDFYYVPYSGERAIIAGAKLRAAEKDAVGEGGRRIPIYEKQYQEWLMRCIQEVESIAEGEAAILGEDADSDGIYQRVWGFNPWQAIPSPP